MATAGSKKRVLHCRLSTVDCRLDASLFIDTPYPIDQVPQALLISDCHWMSRAVARGALSNVVGRKPEPVDIRHILFMCGHDKSRLWPYGLFVQATRRPVQLTGISQCATVRSASYICRMQEKKKEKQTNKKRGKKGRAGSFPLQISRRLSFSFLAASYGGLLQVSVLCISTSYCKIQKDS